jgi:plastocyanin
VKASRAATIVSLLLGSLFLTAPAGAGGGCHAPEGAETSYARSEGKTARVDVANCEFGPTVLYVDPGSEVTWSFGDPMPHSVTGTFLAWGSEELIERGQSVTYAFEDEGVYPYLCVLHPGMSAAVIVGDPGPDTVKALAPPAKLDPPAAGPRAPEMQETSSSATGAVIGIAGVLALVLGAGLYLARRKGPTAGEATPA